MSARDTILGAVRAALGKPTADPAAIRREAAELLQDLAPIRPEPAAGSLVDAFIARVTSPRVAATAERVRRASDLPAAVGRYLATNALPPVVSLQPAAMLQRLDWLALEARSGVEAGDIVAVGLARWGIAETGSLVFHSGAETPILGNFLPVHHIVMLRASSILPYLEDYAAAVVGERPPRNVNLITGASGTTDIEGSLVLGAHGPGRLHVVIVDEDDDSADQGLSS